MKLAQAVAVSLAAGILALATSFCNSKAQSKKPGSGFAVVELYTSEGCSSCPPADEAMIRLSKEFTDNVYFLGFHVDYWDRLGWKDQFDNSAYSDRQENYSRKFGADAMYTPQAIVNGELEMVGSREDKLKSIIESDLKKPTSISIELKAFHKGNKVTVDCKFPATAGSTLQVALVQKNAVSEVKAGENKGHTLNHMNIVRDFKSIAADKKSDLTTDLTIPGNLDAKDCRVIVFLQINNSLLIQGANETAID